jgi:hypothetical protein
MKNNKVMKNKIVISLAIIVVLLVSAIFVVEIPNIFPPPKKTSTTTTYSAGDYMTATISYTTPSGQTGTVTLNSNAQPSGTTLSMIGTGASNSIPAGSTINSINTNLDMIPTYSLLYGTSVSSYTVAGSFTTELIGATSSGANTGSALYTSSSIAMSPVSPLPTLSSGNSVIICSSTVSSSAIQGCYSGWHQGNDYNWIDTCSSPSMTIVFSDGSSVTQTASSCSFTLDFAYQSSNTFTSLSAVFAMSTS